jgi:hypothetical protein
MEESGLERARPQAHIRFSRPQGYPELLDQIKVHGYNMIQERGTVLRPEEIAGDWYDRVYLPTIEGIRAAGLRDVLPSTTEGDLYLAVQQHLVAMAPERGKVTFQEAAADLRDSVAGRIRTGRTLRPGRGAGRSGRVDPT